MVVAWFYPDKTPSSLVPAEDAAIDLGKIDKRWNYLYAVMAVLTMLTVGNIYVSQFAQIANANITINGSDNGHLYMDNAGMEFYVASGSRAPAFMSVQTPDTGFMYEGSDGAWEFKTGNVTAWELSLFGGHMWSYGRTQTQNDVAAVSNTVYGNWIITPVLLDDDTCLTTCAALTRACVLSAENTTRHTLLDCNALMNITDTCLCTAAQWHT